MKLDELKKGEKGKVISIENSNYFFKRRMLDMGITKGVEISVSKIAPFGDPISIKLRGYELCLRKKELNNVGVIKI